MRVMILGIDGYLGWPLAMHLKARGHDVMGIDSGIRRQRVRDCGSDSAFDIPEMMQRSSILGVPMFHLHLPSSHLKNLVKEFQPDTIVYLAEQPSAPYSMINDEKSLETIQDNVMGTAACLWAMRKHAPGCHLLHLGCYDDRTEVLTDRGWVLFSDLSDGDDVCCLEPETNQIQYHKPTAIVDYPHDGVMMEVDTRNVNCCVTPNHRVVHQPNGEGMVAVTDARSMPEGFWWFYRSGKWTNGDVEFFTIPGMTSKGPWGSERHRDPVNIPMDAWLRFFGLWLSDGCVRHKNGKPSAARISVKKDRKKTAVAEAAAALEPYFHTSVTHKPSGFDEFETSNVQLAAYLSQFGTARTKYIPREILCCSTRQLEILYQSMMDGDGSRGPTGDLFFSTSMQLLDDMQEICLKAGRVGKICRHERVNGDVEHYVSVSSHRMSARIDDDHRQWIPYNGRVYCCTVPTGIIMTRRNGTVCWSGNTMGTYGTPNVDIPEGWFDLEFRGRKTRAQFPKCCGSMYHGTKCCDAVFVEFACRNWGLRATDVMQGVVYGTRTPEMGDPIDPQLRTRYDFDGIFGTAVNRYCAQAVLGLPITPYGKGGQTRGWLPLQDSIQCLRLAIENPPKPGEYRVVNQLEECYSVRDLADIVAQCAVEVGIGAHPEVAHVANPRKEAEEHYYNPDHEILLQLGYQPKGDLRGTIREMLVDLGGVSERLAKYAGAIEPRVKW